MDLTNHIAPEQKQALSASQVQALNILALTNQELEDFMVNEYLENPLLERTEQKENDIMTSIEKFSDSDAGTSYADQHPGNPDDREHFEKEFSARSGDPLKELLLGQLNWKDYTKQQMKIMSYLVDCLDEKGFFTHDTGELSAGSGYPKEELDRCLAVLRELEPAGIFAPNLEECLIKQLEEKDLADETVCVLLRNYLTELVSGQIGTISRSLGISTIRVKEYIHLIGSLNPRPIMDIQAEESSYVVPDIIVSRPGGKWSVEINDQWTGEYRFSDYYIQMMKDATDPELTAYFKERLERARFVVSCVEQRRKTITRIMEAILLRQEDYFEHQDSLKPMGMEDIAADLGIHVSTVSRAVKGKYVQYKKTEPLKSLFTSALSRDGEREGVSSGKIKERIRALIAGEEKKPLSDQKLAEKLAEEGITVSRRAVAKYRIQMNIPDSRQRGLRL
ncbi:MAG: RNA polymerase factor sigma-54 [Ruminococcus sp.]|nr:RNA polymerase factor sigma-54 [Ruminococcus sp.]